MASRKFELELDISKLQQGDLDARANYQVVVTLWTEHDMLTTSLVFYAASAEVIRERSSLHLIHFMMKLCPEFEGIRASLLHRNVAKVEDVLGELIREESR
ncbi:unnamed protein product [Linum trigynum]|uniref:Uncharacterized protein n=1 Tax=Linum trigynum TaxID=586398 RepID=A0AAV2FTI5_9ROSI